MSTRGLIGFVLHNETKATYNHSDSYPGGLGLEMLRFARTASSYGQAHHAGTSTLKQQVKNLKVVREDSTPTAEQIAALSEYMNTIVSSGQATEWYVLLRGTQGDPAKMLEAGYITDGFDFGKDSLFCEWGYVIDLDAGTLDVYEGFNQTGKTEGIWAIFGGTELPVPGGGSPSTARPEPGYGPITRVASFPLDKLPTDQEFLTILGEPGASGLYVQPSDDAATATELDTESSASRQHFIDTGKHLPHAGWTTTPDDIVPTPATFTLDQVQEVLNKVVHDIDMATTMPGTGTRDALNLMVNATINYLAGVSSTLEEVAERNYSATFTQIIGWIDGDEVEDE
jgi:hypothetical protein